MIDTFGFHALFPHPAEVESCFRATDAVAGQLGLTPVSEGGGQSPSRRYARPGLDPIEIGFALEAPWAQWAIYPVSQSSYAAYGGALIEKLIVTTCEALDSRLGRSFHPGGIALVHAREVEGDVDCLDWLQYFGPPVVARIGLDRLRKAQFFSFEQREDGGCVAKLGESPYEVLLSIRQAASDLGIRLRPVYTKDASGNPIEMGWN
jgi:hypothetical protein